MSLIKKNFKTSVPRPTIMPKSWSTYTSHDNALFNNLDHFVYTVSKLKQAEDGKCGMSYEEALRKLIKKESDFPESQQESIRNLVRKNLQKRGLITEEVYENFRYSADGTNVGVDIGKYAAGDPDCVITPSRQYIDFFYELYISISYNANVSDETVRANVAKLLATIEELERQHIYIKVNVIFPTIGSGTQDGHKNFFSCIPVFSHKDQKSVNVMSSVVNERLLRKFYFAILEDLYGRDLSGGYGRAIDLADTVNIGGQLDEIELFKSITEAVGA